MNRRVIITVALLSSLTMACSMPALNQEAKKPPVQAAATTNGDACQTRANSRLALFDKPDTYPISADEKRNAYLALYNECMKEYEVQVASPKPNFEYAQANDAGLASLSPAAGGNMAGKPANNYPPGVVVIPSPLHICRCRR